MTDRVVLITGGASGIGAATVARFRADGARVAAIDLDGDALATIDCEYRVTADASDVAAVHAAVAEVAAAMGGIDVAIANAGISRPGTVETTTAEVWDLVMAVNARSVYALAQATLPHLRARQGAFVAVASQLALVAAAGAAAYCASKGAVVSLTRAMAVDHGPEGVRFNCVCPGPTDTPLAAAFFEGSGDAVGTRRAFEAAGLHNRLVEPAEIADAIAYLASPTARSTMGAALVVDAGFIIR